MAGDGEAEARAAGVGRGVGAGAADLEEAFEDARLFFGGDAAAVVSDGDFDVAVAGTAAKDGDPACVGELDRVVDKVVEDEIEEKGVGDESMALRGAFCGPVEAPGFEGMGEAGAEIDEEVREVQGLSGEAGVGGFQPGQVEHLADEGFETSGVAVDDGEEAARGVGCTVHLKQGFDGGADGGERRAEFV